MARLSRACLASSATCNTTLSPWRIRNTAQDDAPTVVEDEPNSIDRPNHFVRTLQVLESAELVNRAPSP